MERVGGGGVSAEIHYSISLVTGAGHAYMAFVLRGACSTYDVRNWRGEGGPKKSRK